MFIVPGQTRVADPTPHSRELGRRVEQVVREYQREHSELTTGEIRTALLHSTQIYEDEGALTRRRLSAILTVVIAAAVAGVMVLAEGSGASGSAGAGVMWKVAAGTVAAVAIVIAVFRAVQRR